MTMLIPLSKLSELFDKICQIFNCSCISCHNLPSLLGLISFVTPCVHPERIFMASLLTGLHSLQCDTFWPISEEIKLISQSGCPSYHITMTSQLQSYLHPLIFLILLSLIIVCKVLVVCFSMNAVTLRFPCAFQRMTTITSMSKNC